MNRHRPKSSPRRPSRWLLVVAIAAGVGLSPFLVLLGGYIWVARDLPDIDAVQAYRPDVSTIVTDRDGAVLAEFFVQRRVVVSLETIPGHVLDAFQSVEDVRFRSHPGVDVLGILRAILANLAAGRPVEGASTITQQLARNMFLSHERTLTRKLKEQVLAFRIERSHTKAEILTMYLNQIYMGHGNYGVEAASRFYFGKSVADVSVVEAAMLAALPKGPELFTPRRYPERALRRRNLVLDRMAAADVITAEAAARLKEQPIDLAEVPDRAKIAPYFVEEVRRFLFDRFGRETYRGGLRVETTLDRAAQEAAEAATHAGLDAYRARHPSREEPPQHALLALRVGSGEVLAMVGGRDYNESEFNRATQGRRQIGSTVKPWVYAAAIQRGYTPASIIHDVPTTFFADKPWRWTPGNYSGRHYGPTRLREALARSRNVPAAIVAEEIGVGSVISLLRRAGVASPMEPHLALSLGAADLTLAELARSYAVFANRGIAVEPSFIRRVTDADGVVLYEHESRTREVLPVAVAGLMNHLLHEVVATGTARKARSLGFPVAGKTGTTNNNTDAWFIGFSEEVVCGVWVGYDQPRSLGRRETGGKAALPIWIEFMGQVHNRPSESQGPPAWTTRRLDEVLICPESGQFAGRPCPQSITEVFLPGTAPQGDCPVHRSGSRVHPGAGDNP